MSLIAMACALVALAVLLVRGRAGSPAVIRAAEPPQALEALPWNLLLNEVFLICGISAFAGGAALTGNGFAALAVWGVLWPLSVEIASAGHPYRVVRLLRVYTEHQPVFPWTADHRRYKRVMRPLWATEAKLFGLGPPVVAAGIGLTLLITGSF